MEPIKGQVKQENRFIGRQIKMKLVIGGYAQGKLNFVLSKYQIPENAVWDGLLPDNSSFQEKEPNRQIIIHHFHQWVKNRMSEGGCPEEEIFLFLEHCENCIIISDEIGNGIVPMDPFERDYRERVGRILIQLAEQSEEVWRVLCGIGQKIKG